MNPIVTDHLEDAAIDDALCSMLGTVLEEEYGLKPRRKQISRNNDPAAAQQYLAELLNCGHSERIKSALRMSLDTFISLCNWLVKYTQLKASMHITLELKVAVFLMITTRPASQRDVMDRYPIGNRQVSE
jgi:hypothetical protein